VQHIEQARYHLLDYNDQYISANSILGIKFCLADKVTSRKKGLYCIFGLEQQPVKNMVGLYLHK